MFSLPSPSFPYKHLLTIHSQEYQVLQTTILTMYCEKMCFEYSGIAMWGWAGEFKGSLQQADYMHSFVYSSETCFRTFVSTLLLAFSCRYILVSVSSLHLCVNLPSNIHAVTRRGVRDRDFNLKLTMMRNILIFKLMNPMFRKRRTIITTSMMIATPVTAITTPAYCQLFSIEP